MQWPNHTSTLKGGQLIALLFVGFLYAIASRASTLIPADFNAPWISDCHADSLSHVWFRKMYVMDGRPRQATLTITTTGRVKVYVNACNVGTAVYYPARADGDNRPLTFSLDVSPYLNADTNIVALLYSPAAPSIERRSVAVTFAGTSHDGKAFCHMSDSSWLCRKANSGLTADGDEWIDGRGHNTDWNTTSYAAALWTPVSTSRDSNTAAEPPYAAAKGVPTITWADTQRDPETHGRDLVLPLATGFYGFITATLRGARKGESIRLGRLTYICNGEIDEQAWPQFSTAYWGNAVVEGDRFFRPEQVTTIQAISISNIDIPQY